MGCVECCIWVDERFELSREDGEELRSMRWGCDVDWAMEGIGTAHIRRRFQKKGNHSQ